MMLLWTKEIFFCQSHDILWNNDIMIVWTRPVSNYCFCYSNNWASEATPTLGCSIEISRDICRYVSYVKLTA